MILSPFFQVLRPFLQTHEHNIESIGDKVRELGDELFATKKYIHGASFLQMATSVRTHARAAFSTAAGAITSAALNQLPAIQTTFVSLFVDSCKVPLV